jgi:hypothetical protein
MNLNEPQKQIIKWVAIIGIGGVIIYKAGSKLGLFTEPLNQPNADINLPKAKDYTHSPNFEPAATANKIKDFFGWFSGDPFTELFAYIKRTIRTQGDWQDANQAFNNLYGEDIFKYMQDLGGGVLPIPFWAELTTAELNQISNYINKLPL